MTQMSDRRTFSLKPFEDRWFSWQRIAPCFWPGLGKLAASADPLLAPVRTMGGVYLIGWGEPEKMPAPTDPAVQYVGQTSNFKRRMKKFKASGGFDSLKRRKGHSAAGRWPLGKNQKMHVAFFPLKENVLPHMATGLLYLEEALALDAYYRKYGKLPPLNSGPKDIELD